MKNNIFEVQNFNGLSYTQVGIGTAKLGAFWQKRTVKDGLESMRYALDQGVKLVDTADVYSRGISERIVGKATQPYDDVTIMTKVGLLKTPNNLRLARKYQQKISISGLKQNSEAGKCFAPDYIEASALRCMKRQGKTELDVLLLHEPDSVVISCDLVNERLESMKARGMVREWGVSVRDMPSALTAVNNPYLGVIQFPTNLSDSSVADAVLKCKTDDKFIIGLAVFGDGSLITASAQAGLSIPRTINTLVRKTLNHEAIDAVLIGMSSIQHTEENFRALSRPYHEADAVSIAQNL